MSNLIVLQLVETWYWVDLMGSDSCIKRDSFYVNFLKGHIVQDDTAICNYQNVLLSTSHVENSSYVCPSKITDIDGNEYNDAKNDFIKKRHYFF